MRYSLRAIRPVILAAAALFVAPVTAQAATITVSTHTDGTGNGSCPASPCALRQAINFAHAGDKISVPAGTYSLTPANGPLSVAKALTIVGAGAATTKLTQSGAIQLLSVSDANVSVAGITFQGGIAPSSGQQGGAGGAISNYGTLFITNSKFVSNYAFGGNASGTNGGDSSYGGAIYNAGVLAVSSSSFSGNVSFGGNGAVGGNSGQPGHGGAIYSENDGRLTVGGTSFDGNFAEPGAVGTGASAYAPTAGQGGAIYGRGVVSLSSDHFGSATPNQAVGGAATSNSAGVGGQGGAIYLNYAAATLTGNSFPADRATGGLTGPSYGRGGQGGAIYIYYGRLNITGGTFGAGDLAGGAQASGAGYGEGGDGGAIYNDYATVKLSGGTFSGNTAGGGEAGSSQGGQGGTGGSLYGYGTFVVSGSTFTNNVAGAGASTGAHAGGGGEGGAVEIDGSLTVSGSTFSGNVARAATGTSTYGGYGGAAYLYDGAISFSKTTFNSNTAAGGSNGGGEGGAIYTDAANLSISASRFSGNKATAPSGSSSGGAIYASEGGTSVDTSSFTGNVATNGDGGAIYSGATVRLLASTLSGNTSGYGGAFDSDGVDSIVDSTITQNTATNYGGGLYAEEVTALDNVTLVANTAGTSDGGGNLYLNSGHLTVHDSIITGGHLSAGTGDENCYIVGPLNVDSQGYNLEDRNQCSLTGPGDRKNVTAPHLGALAANGGPTKTIALLAGSPAINAGDPAGCRDDNGVALATDQRGRGRPSGGRCDIGAYEFQQAPPPQTPVISGLAASPTSFSAQSQGGSISAAQGTTVSYTDTEAAATTFTVTGSFKGYRAHGKGRCRPLPKTGAPAGSKPCTRIVNEGSFSHQDAAGANHFHFTGRVSGRTLVRGHYVLSAVPRFHGLTGHVVTVKFQIT